MIHLDYDTQALKNESHPKVQKKVKDILRMCAGARQQIRMSSMKTWFTSISATRNIIMHKNAKPRPCTHKDLKEIDTTIISMDIELLSVDTNPCGHQIGKQM